MKYRGNNIWPDEQTNGQTGRRDSLDAFVDTVRWSKHNKNKYVSGD